MKKIFLLFVISLACVGSALAQVWVCGNIGYSSLGYHIEENGSTRDYRTHEFQLNPSIGYDVNDHYTVGLNLGYNYSYTPTSHYSVSNDFSIAPFVRYYFADWKSLKFYAEGDAVYNLSHLQNDENQQYKRFGFAVIPGVDYAITDRIGIEATIGTLNWKRTNFKDNVKQNSWLFNVNSGLTLGLYFYL